MASRNTGGSLELHGWRGGRTRNKCKKKNKTTYVSQHEDHFVDSRHVAILEQTVLVRNTWLHKLFPLLAELRELGVTKWISILLEPNGH